MKALFLLFLSCLAVAREGFTERRLVIVSPHWEGIRHEFEWAFQDYIRQQHGDEVRVTWLDAGGTSEILRYITHEFDRSPSTAGIDLLFGGGVEPFEELRRRGLLESVELSAETLSAIPRELAGVPLYAPDHTWYAPVLGAFGILCNAEVLKRLQLPPPASWEDLGTAKFSSWIASADPRKSGSAHMVYEIILQAYGWERGWQLLFRIGRNVRNFGSASNQPQKDVEAGEVACAFALDSQAWATQRHYSEREFPFVLPQGLSLITPDAAGVLKGAPNESTAKSFLEFLMRPEGQQLWSRPRGSRGGPREHDLARMPVLPSMYQDPSASLVHLNPYSWQPSFPFSTRKASQRWNVLNDLIGVFLIERSTAGEAKVPSETAIAEASQRWNDPSFRDYTIREWKKRSSRREALAPLLLPWLVLLLGTAFYALRRFLRRKRIRAL